MMERPQAKHAAIWSSRYSGPQKEQGVPRAWKRRREEMQAGLRAGTQMGTTGR